MSYFCFFGCSLLRNNASADFDASKSVGFFLDRDVPILDSDPVVLEPAPAER